MIIADNIKQFHSIRNSLIKQQKIGFVPTMGALH
ncbi:pantothenate synthetase, partial [Francisella tularensis subsp. holarctica]|nr:pantothenate synthetase [Francisella tularensis subsp. holarctica]